MIVLIHKSSTTQTFYMIFFIIKIRVKLDSYDKIPKNIAKEWPAILGIEILVWCGIRKLQAVRSVPSDQRP